jgi:hypothetical protein
MGHVRMIFHRVHPESVMEIEILERFRKRRRILGEVNSKELVNRLFLMSIAGSWRLIGEII